MKKFSFLGRIYNITRELHINLKKYFYFVQSEMLPMPNYVLKAYPIAELEPGMEIGADVFKSNGKILLTEGTVLSASLIRRLESWGIGTVEIRQASDGEIFTITPPVIDTKFYETYCEAVEIIKSTFDAVRFFKKIPFQNMQKLSDHCLASLIHMPGAIKYLNLERCRDEYTFHHSVNVAIISGILGKWLSYDGEELQHLILAGLLHDIGKTQIPQDILNYPGELNQQQMDIMKLHTVHGYQLLSEIPDLPKSICYGALQHHERYDGSGYPSRVNQEKIHPFARIIAIADIYDAMTSDKVYKEKVTPFVVAKTLKSDMFDKLDPTACNLFLENLSDNLLGDVVELQDGREAQIIHLGSILSAMPILRTAGGEFINIDTYEDICEVKPLIPEGQAGITRPK